MLKGPISPFLNPLLITIFSFVKEIWSSSQLDFQQFCVCPGTCHPYHTALNWHLTAWKSAAIDLEGLQQFQELGKKLSSAEQRSLPTKVSYSLSFSACQGVHIVTMEDYYSCYVSPPTFFLYEWEASLPQTPLYWPLLATAVLPCHIFMHRPMNLQAPFLQATTAIARGPWPWG